MRSKVEKAKLFPYNFALGGISHARRKRKKHPGRDPGYRK